MTKQKKDSEFAVNVQDGDVDLVIVYCDKGNLSKDFDIGKTKFNKGEEYDVYFVTKIKDADGNKLEYHSESPKNITIPKPDVKLEVTSAELTNFFYDFNNPNSYTISFALKGVVAKEEGLSDPKEGFVIVKDGDAKDEVKKAVRSGTLPFVVETDSRELDFEYKYDSEKPSVPYPKYGKEI